jgi:hypothetical protein
MTSQIAGNFHISFASRGGLILDRIERWSFERIREAVDWCNPVGRSWRWSRVHLCWSSERRDAEDEGDDENSYVNHVT